MIFAQVESSRSFVGCLDVQCELLASMKAICDEKGIDSAHITGYGYLEDPVIQKYSRAEAGYIAPQKQDGMYVVPLIHGSVSVGEDDKPEVLLFVQGAASERGRTKTIAGRLVSATVRQFEFFIQTVDNVILNRLTDKQTGLHLWLQMLPVGMKCEPTMAQTAAGAPALSGPSEEEDFGDDDLQIEEGDWLNHPRLGMCYVMTFDGEDRIKVRLKSGRIAELLMAMFKLTLEGVREGGKVFKVEVRKRR